MKQFHIMRVRLTFQIFQYIMYKSKPGLFDVMKGIYLHKLEW